MLQGQHLQIWTLHKKNQMMIVGTLLETKIMDRFYKIHSIEKDTSKRIHVVRGED